MERTGEKRARRKSRKVSETELAVEEPSPPAKRRKKSSGGKSIAGSAPSRPGPETKKARAADERAKKKRLMVSFDVMEHNLNVGEGVASTGSCTLTVSSADGGGERGGGGGGGGGGRGGAEANGEGMAVKRPSVDIKFKNSKFTVSQPSAIPPQILVPAISMLITIISSTTPTHTALSLVAPHPPTLHYY